MIQAQRYRAYGIVTAAYWAFMLTDGALRMMVLLHFHKLGYSPLQLSYLFILYELMGIVTNSLAGWLATRIGLNKTLYIGLSLQIIALTMLSQFNSSWAVALSLTYVMTAQALSGVAKDLTKTSAKSAIKQLTPKHQNNTLFRWVALLTGSKNMVKGLGFFAGGALLAFAGFTASLWILAALLIVVLILVTIQLKDELGQLDKSVTLKDALSPSRNINRLSAARLFLFGSRDTWFVVAVPIFLSNAAISGLSVSANTAFFLVGGFMALWIVAYGLIQIRTPKWLGRSMKSTSAQFKTASRWALILSIMCALLAILSLVAAKSLSILIVLMMIGLLLFGAIFAVNSSIHSFLILSLTTHKRAAQDVGFYYMSNAAGRLLGTLLSGLSYQLGGLPLSLGLASTMALISWWFARQLSP